MKLKTPKKMQLILEQNGGVITTAEAKKIGISNEHLRLLTNSGNLERIAFGIYILPDEFIDKMYITQLRVPKIIYSHETALYLHDLTDRDPVNYSITVPRGYNVQSLRQDNFSIFTIKSDLYKIGKTELTTMFGNTVIAYDMERTICDCLRSRNKMDIAIITDAVKRYVKRKGKNLTNLMLMAEKFKVNKPLRSYLEVLL